MQAVVAILVQDLAKIRKVTVQSLQQQLHPQQRPHPQPVNKQALAQPAMQVLTQLAMQVLAQLAMQVLVTVEQVAVMITEMAHTTAAHITAAHTTAKATVAAPVLPVPAVMKNKLNLFQKKLKFKMGGKCTTAKKPKTVPDFDRQWTQTSSKEADELFLTYERNKVENLHQSD